MLTPTEAGAELARVYAKEHPLSQENPGKVWGYYDKEEDCIVIQGEGLKPRDDMAHLYPNGWSLLDKVTCEEARDDIANGFAQLKEDV